KEEGDPGVHGLGEVPGQEHPELERVAIEVGRVILPLQQVDDRFGDGGDRSVVRHGSLLSPAKISWKGESRRRDPPRRAIKRSYSNAPPPACPKKSGYKSDELIPGGREAGAPVGCRRLTIVHPT